MVDFALVWISTNLPQTQRSFTVKENLKCRADLSYRQTYILLDLYKEYFYDVIITSSQLIFWLNFPKSINLPLKYLIIKYDNFSKL